MYCGRSDCRGSPWLLARREGVLILLVEDEEGLRESIAFALENENFQVRTAATLADASQLVQERRPELVILDVMLPDGCGAEFCQELRTLGDLRILLLSARGEHHHRVRGLESGADDYLCKPFDYPELLARVRALLRRWSKVEPFLTYQGLKLDTRKHCVFQQGRELPLTLLEFRLLEVLLGRPETVFSRQDLLSRVWGIDMPLDSNVLEVTVSNLRAKLGDKSRKRIRTVRGVGYALGGPDCSISGSSRET